MAGTAGPRATRPGWFRLLAAAVVTTGVAGFAMAAFEIVGPRPARAVPAGGMTATEVAAMFGGYGDAGGHWTGGDSTVSVLLPDGRVAWLFADTFLGVVNPDGSRPRATPMVSNTLVVQDGRTLVDTRHGGDATWPSALVRPAQPGEFFWVADGIVESGTMKVLYNRYRRTGAGALDVELTGTSLATFALPDLTVSSVVDLPVGKAITWGAAILVDGGYTYVYGTSDGLGGLQFAHLARVPVGDLGGAWQFWTGTTWSGSESAAGRLLSGVGKAFAVQKVGSQYLLVTQQTNFLFDPQFVAYTAASPTGPFTGPVHLLTAPEQEPGTEKVVYAARLHPDLARPGKLLMSYDVNSLDTDDVYADARLYRPRFVELGWPRPAPGPVPAAPTGLTASADTAGVVHLRWTAVSGATGYHVYRRDVTGGETHFGRQRQPVSQPSADVGSLITGHRYEFRVTAASSVGESPASATVTATSQVVRDASIIRLANTPEAVAGSYFVRFKDSSAVRSRGVEALARELLAQSGGTLDRLFPLTLRGFSAILSEAQAIDLAGHPDVLDVEQDQVVTLDGEQIFPDDPPDPVPPDQYRWNWGLDRIDQRSLPMDRRYRYPDIPGLDRVHVYVVDSGIRTTHLTFSGRARWGENLVRDGIDTDCHGHGTHVAGIVGGLASGVAKQVQLIAVKVIGCSGSSTNTSIAHGIEWATNDAKRAENRDNPAVVNISASVASTDPRAINIGHAAREAVKAGLTVVASAGNQGIDARRRSPAGLEEVITVGNVNDRDHRHTGPEQPSNYGIRLDLFAPGTAIYSADSRNNTGYRTFTGTSMAAPHVAGVAAMIRAAHSDLSPVQVEQVLVETATRDVVQERGEGSPNRLLFVPQPPAQAPGNLAAMPNPDGTIGLTWNPVHTPDANVFYRVSQRDVTAGETSFARWREPVFDGTTATARGLVEGHTYEFKVAAATSTGIGPESNVASAVAHMNPPGAPSNLTATAAADGTIRLAWTAPAPDVWYWVYQRDLTAGEADFTRLSLPITTCCTMTAGLLVHDHTYEFKVAAVNVGGEGPPSNLAQARARHPAPAPPTGLTATSGDGQVTLTWTASPTPNVWYWVYQRNLSAQETAFTRLPLPATCCTVTPGFLANGDTYEFRLTAIGPGGESTPGNAVRARPLPPKPPRVTGLTAVPQPDGTIRLTWNALGGVYYWIHQRDVTTGQGFTRLSVPTDQTSFTAGLLTHNHVYEFRISAENLAGEGPHSDPKQATSRYSPPGAPTNLRGTTSGDGYIALDWDAPGPGGLLYWVYHRDVTAGQISFTRSGLPTDQTSARLGPFIHNHVYEFKVSAESQGGEGPASSTVRVSSLGGLPLPPSGLSAQAGDGQVVLRWTASPSPSVWYWVEYRPAGGGWQRLLDTTCCDFTVAYLANGTTYEFRVRATNASGDSATSNQVAARPMPPLPQPPTGLTAQAGDGQVTLRWTASPSPNVWYWLELRANGGVWQRAPYPITTCCTFTSTLLINGVTYEFRLRSTNLSGDSAPSNTATARPMPPFPQPPVALTAQAGDRQVRLSWTTSPTRNVYYWIEYRREAGEWQRLPYPTGCCSFTVSMLQNHVNYAFRVRATNLSGDSEPSNVVFGRPAAPVGCYVWAFDPAFEGIYDEVPIMVTRGPGYANCVGPVYDARVSAMLIPVAGGYEPYPPSSTTDIWGTVGGSRSGWVVDRDNAPVWPFHPGRCRYYYLEAKVTWRHAPGGFLWTTTHYSRTVGVGPDCGPPA